jgi:hypothetical protein
LKVSGEIVEAEVPVKCHAFGSGHTEICGEAHKQWNSVAVRVRLSNQGISL